MSLEVRTASGPISVRVKSVGKNAEVFAEDGRVIGKLVGVTVEGREVRALIQLDRVELQAMELARTVARLTL